MVQLSNMQNKISVATKRIEEALSAVGSLRIDGAAVSCTCETGYAVTARAGDVESVEHHQQVGFVITVYHNDRASSVYTTDLSELAVQCAVEKASFLVNEVECDPASGLPDESALAFDYPDLSLSHPWEQTPSEAVEKAIAMECQARGLDKRVLLSEGVSISSYTGMRFLANSLGLNASYATTEHSMSLSLVAGDDEHRHADYEYTQARTADALMSADELVTKAVDRVTSRIGARQITTRECPVIFSPSMAKSLLRSFVSAISGRQLYRRSSFLLDSIDQQIFPEFVTISQRPHRLMGMGSAPFDSEGVLTRDFDLVHSGVLQSYLLSSYSARKLGLETTGNAGGVYNMMVEPTVSDQVSLLREMGTGLLVTELMGQGVNLTTGNYSRGAFGYWVENGEIMHPVEEVTIAGNLKDIFANIAAIGGDVDDRGRIHTGSILVKQMMVAGA